MMKTTRATRSKYALENQVWAIWLQGVHSHIGHDARPNLAQLLPVEWEARTLAQVAEKRMHSAADAAVRRASGLVLAHDTGAIGLAERV